MSEEKNKIEKKYYDYASVGNRTAQRAYFVQNHDKNRMFEELLKDLTKKQILVMVKSKRAADGLTEYLREKNISVLSAHGNHRPEHIQEMALAFNDKKSNIFITTDRILEKLTLMNIEILMNYDLPLKEADYLTRLLLVDEVGESISLIDPEDEKMLALLEHMMKRAMDEVEIENFEHTKHEKIQVKDKIKKPRHKKVEQRAKRKAEIKSQWVPKK